MPKPLARLLTTPAALGLAALVGLGGCVHRVNITSTPPGATVTMSGQKLGVTPLDTKVWWYPFKPMQTRVVMPGYRTVQIDLSDRVGPWVLAGDTVRPWRWGRLVGAQTRGHHELVLIKTHGPSGTWLPEDAQAE